MTQSLIICFSKAFRLFEKKFFFVIIPAISFNTKNAIIKHLKFKRAENLFTRIWFNNKKVIMLLMKQSLTFYLVTLFSLSSNRKQSFINHLVLNTRLFTFYLFPHLLFTFYSSKPISILYYRALGDFIMKIRRKFLFLFLLHFFLKIVNILSVCSFNPLKVDLLVM